MGGIFNPSSSSGALTLLTRSTLGAPAALIDIQNLAAYKAYYVTFAVQAAGGGTTQGLDIYLNNDTTGADYGQITIKSDGASVTTNASSGGSIQTYTLGVVTVANILTGDIFIQDNFQTNLFGRAGKGSSITFYQASGSWTGAQITRITFSADNSENFATSSVVAVYGVS